MPLLAPGATPYLMLFMVLAIVCAVVVMRSRSQDRVSVTAQFRSFQRSFIIVYLIMFMADWMQGPYVYALYDHYGFSHQDIATLFIMGFGSSMVFGTFVGGLADRFGRKANAIVFGVVYSLSCVTKHFNSFGILLIGRLLGGIATSILMSAFETWMVHEHKKHAFPDEWLSHTFSLMTFGNGIIAILAGLVASTLASEFSLVAPFDGSMVLLIIGTLYVGTSWTENYGDQFATGFSNFRDAWSTLMSNEKVALLGIIQSCFESGMFIFVFEWTPALARTMAPDEKENLPHGLVFACFMVCIMIGSNLFKSLIAWKPVEYFSRYVFLVGAVALAVPVVVNSHAMSLMAFCVFELCCGIYFPAMGTMRGKYVPSEVRATMMNIFRVGLNLIVVMVLANVDKLSQAAVFILCALILAIAALAQQRLFALVESNMSAEDRQKVGLHAGEEVDEALSAKADAHA